MYHRVASLVFITFFCACVGEITGPVQHSDASDAVVTLQGQALDDELATSPQRIAPAPFQRIGAIWEGDRPAAIEVSVSLDGLSWTAWQPFAVHHVEMEQSGVFVGQLEVENGPARMYRLRGADGVATYARLELLTTTASESVEDGNGEGGTSYAPAPASTGVNTRSAWGARNTRCSSRIGNPYRITIHHTETPTNDSVSPEARLRSIQQYHMDVRGWCDVGYHYLMARDGRLYEGRPSHLLGAHTGGANSGNIGIAVMGQHSSAGITSAQVDSLARLVHDLANANGITINRTNIKGHRQHKSTSCPGDALYAQLDTIVAAAADGGAGGGGGGGGGAGGGGDTDTGGTDTVTVLGVLYAGSDTSDRIAGASVSLGARTTTTSATGVFSFDNVPAGGFTLAATAAGYQTRSITRATAGSATWASFGLSPEAAASGTAVLQGVVYEGGDSANRIAGAVIALSTGETATADANGFYKISGLAPGAVTVTASASGYAAASVSRTLVDGQTEWGSVGLAAEGSGGGGSGGGTATSQACFLGADRAGTTCFPLVAATPYTYPAPLNNNYRAPMQWIDVDAVDLSTSIAPNFKLSEISSRAKGKYQVVQPHAIAKLQQVRDQAGNALTINSGFRSPTYNASVGGATSSRHMYGDAFDIMPGAVGQTGLMNICNSLGAGYVAKYDSGHVHCDWRNDAVDPLFYGALAVVDPHYATHPFVATDLRAEMTHDDAGTMSAPARGYDRSEGELLREWTAYDASGKVLATATGHKFTPPRGTHTVKVDVGGLMELTHDVAHR